MKTGKEDLIILIAEKPEIVEKAVDSASKSVESATKGLKSLFKKE